MCRKARNTRNGGTLARLHLNQSRLTKRCLVIQLVFYAQGKVQHYWASLLASIAVNASTRASPSPRIDESLIQGIFSSRIGATTLNRILHRDEAPSVTNTSIPIATDPSWSFHVEWPPIILQEIANSWIPFQWSRLSQWSRLFQDLLFCLLKLITKMDNHYESLYCHYLGLCPDNSLRMYHVLELQSPNPSHLPPHRNRVLTRFAQRLMRLSIFHSSNNRL